MTAHDERHIAERVAFDWGDHCPQCGGTFPFLHGPHPTWVPCDPEYNDGTLSDVRTHTGQVRGEFLDITADDLHPYDILDEGRVVRTVHGSWAWSHMDVGPCHAEVEIIELADGPRCLWQPVWGEVRREEIPRGTFRVFRGDLPGYFCTAEPDGPRDPCSSDQCPIRVQQFDGHD